MGAYLGLNAHVQRGGGRGSADSDGAQRTGEMEEGLSVSHGRGGRGSVKRRNGWLVVSLEALSLSVLVVVERLKLCVGNFTLR